MLRDKYTKYTYFFPIVFMCEYIVVKFCPCVILLDKKTKL